MLGSTLHEVTKLLQVVNLTTEQVIYVRDYAAGLPSTLIWAGISADDRYIAEEDLLQGTTAITELATGRTVAMSVGAELISSSSDDRYVALHVVGKNIDETRVVDLASGRILWNGHGSLGVLFRPGSSDFLVRLDRPNDPRGDYDLLLVPATGAPHIIARQVFVSW